VKLRAVFFDGVTLLLWSFACFIFLGTIGFNLVFDVFGFVAGLVLGVAVALRQLSFLKEKGEIRVTLKTLACVLLIVFTAIPFSLYLVFSFGLETGIKMANFIYPFILALYTARIILYLNWERKHRSLILCDGLLLTRVYAASEIGKLDNIKGAEERVQWKTVEPAILKMKTTKVKRCPVCEEQVFLFDRRHIREKHPEYFNEARKWQCVYIMSIISVFGLMALIFLNNVFYSDAFLRLLASAGTVIVAPFFFFTLLKLRSVAKKYKVPRKKTLPLTGTNN